MERIVPDELTDRFGLQSLQLHCDRYHFAGGHIVPGRVLDIACGTGYGSFLLANEYEKAISEIVSVDFSPESISYARRRYAHPKINYVIQDALNYDDPDKFNTIVSLETIEHLSNPEKFINRLYDLLLPGGVLIISAPVTLSSDINPFHLTDFSDDSFRELFSPFSFTTKNFLQQTQRVHLKDVFGKKKSNRSEGIRKNIPAFYISNPGIFFARLRSILQNGLSNKYTVLVLQKNF